MKPVMIKIYVEIMNGAYHSRRDVVEGRAADRISDSLESVWTIVDGKQVTGQNIEGIRGIKNRLINHMREITK